MDQRTTQYLAVLYTFKTSDKQAKVKQNRDKNITIHLLTNQSSPFAAHFSGCKWHFITTYTTSRNRPFLFQGLLYTLSEPVVREGNHTVRNVLVDFAAVCDRWRNCKASSMWLKVSSKLSNISSHRAKQ